MGGTGVHELEVGVWKVVKLTGEESGLNGEENERENAGSKDKIKNGRSLGGVD